MKKIICLILLVLALTVVLCGCNENWGLGNYSWKHVHFSDTISGHCATITSWHDNETGIELHTKDYGSMFLSEGSYILFESAEDCPYCGGK